MKRYDNGELITKERMEDEEWYYSMYQPFLNVVCYASKSTTVEGLYKDVIESDYIGSAFTTPVQQERLLRWCVLQAERRCQSADVHPTPRFNLEQIGKILSNCKDLEEAKNLCHTKNPTVLTLDNIWTKLLKK